MSKLEYKAVKKLVAEGMLHKDIAKKFGVRPHYVTTKCCEWDIKSAKTWASDKVQLLKTLLDKKYTYQQIAEEMNESISRVQSYCHAKRLEYKAGREPVKPETIKKIVELLKQQMNTAQIRRIIPGISARQILYYKAKHDIDGIKRGGCGSVPKDELECMKELASHGLSINQICKGMKERLGKDFTYNCIRGRLRCYHVPILGQKTWTAHESTLIEELVKLGVSFGLIRKRFSDKSPKSIRYKMKAIRTGY